MGGSFSDNYSFLEGNQTIEHSYSFLGDNSKNVDRLLEFSITSSSTSISTTSITITRGIATGSSTSSTAARAYAHALF